MYPLLLSPLRLRGHELRNRVVFTAHTASFSEDGIPGSRAREYYAARARGGAGLIVMEPLPVLPSAGVTPQNYRWRRRALRSRAHEPCARRCTSTERCLVSQLYHLGPNADPTATMEGLWSVSAGRPPDGGPGRMREIDDRRHRGARRRSRRGGADCARRGRGRCRVHVRVRHARRRLHVGSPEPARATATAVRSRTACAWRARFSTRCATRSGRSRSSASP